MIVTLSRPWRIWRDKIAIRIPITSPTYLFFHTDLFQLKLEVLPGVHFLRVEAEPAEGGAKFLVVALQGPLVVLVAERLVGAREDEVHEVQDGVALLQRLVVHRDDVDRPVLEIMIY